ncbi:MAG: hypothetical protein Harvfovirus2_64 [Harvfovirus sp.]|uniref:PH domain-containing protein n=1 Tax=Harvfovirus sp. TaxID=2487768 RepID=A0A3G5A205_9VIRU|nr:MAG: hypothetical protein Harvfovirus2_64 [Harvfovirus sp.]
MSSNPNFGLFTYLNTTDETKESHVLKLEMDSLDWKKLDVNAFAYEAVRKFEIIIFCVDGSLFWGEKGSIVMNSMPLKSIRDVFLGERGPFFPDMSKSKLLSQDVVRNSCFSLVTDSGFCLNLDVQCKIKRHFWLQALWSLLVKRGTICLAISSEKTVSSATVDESIPTFLDN